MEAKETGRSFSVAPSKYKQLSAVAFSWSLCGENKCPAKEHPDLNELPR